jgi:hypothetical protein
VTFGPIFRTEDAVSIRGKVAGDPNPYSVGLRGKVSDPEKLNDVEKTFEKQKRKLERKLVLKQSWRLLL